MRRSRLRSAVVAVSTQLTRAYKPNHVRELIRGSRDAGLSCAFWTPDGRYLIYRLLRPPRSDIWALPLQTALLRGPGKPIQLTNGPLSYRMSLPSRDGRQIFAIGTSRRGELVRYDTKMKGFVPFLGGISAIDPTFSRDGQWVAYTSYSDHTLWRSRADGTDRLQLTYPPWRFLILSFLRMVTRSHSRLSATESTSSACKVAHRERLRTTTQQLGPGLPTETRLYLT